jgi:predicted Kef-type K+ transport protein
MSITAFPVLARIIHEKGIARTRLGTLTLAAGASDDALAWCLLAVVLSRLEGTAATAVVTIVGAAAFTAGMLTVGRRLLAPLRRSTGPRPDRMVTALAVLMLSAWTTHAIGIHAVFGAFVAGVAMPRGRASRSSSRRTLVRDDDVLRAGVLRLLRPEHAHRPAGESGALGARAPRARHRGRGQGLACTAAARAAGEPWRARSRSACS